ncbi:MAG: hypothetical protein ACLFR1_10555 [Spirochaetia bacterium]
MKRNAGFTINSLFFLQLSVAIFFLASGILGLAEYNSTANEVARGISQLLGGSTNQTVNVIIYIVEVISGAIILISLFVPTSTRMLYFATIAILIIWIIKMIYTHIGGGIFEATFLIWLQRLSVDLIVLTSIWVITGRYR